MAGPIKQTTGLAGLAVEYNAKPVLQDLYSKIVRSIQPIPKENFYRQSVERMALHRLRILDQHDDLRTIEREIDAGQVEELIWEAKDELNKMIPLVLEHPEMTAPKEDGWEPRLIFERKINH